MPLEDIGFVILEDSAITLSHQLLRSLTEQKAAMITCGENHMPQGLLLPIEGHTTHAEILRAQLDASKPLQKKLWQQLVMAKILNQACLLEFFDRKEHVRLREIVKSVKSGDSDNREGMAARIYWQSLFGDQAFVRDPDGLPPNHLLNYGYAIFRAAVARALTASGLHCAVGLHHHNRYNAFALADDMIEPFRPFVDRTVSELAKSNTGTSLTKEQKARLLETLTVDVFQNGQRKPLLLGVSHSASSLVKCLKGEESQLLCPAMK